MNDYTYNKSPKDRKLCQMIRRTITLQKKEIGLEFKDVANELGMSHGTLESKLKPAKDQNDLTLTEYIHFLELTGEYASLEYIASLFDMVLVPKKETQAKTNDINLLVDVANIKSGDVFRVTKMAIKDGVITQEEKDAMLKKIEDEQKAYARLRDLVLHLEIQEGE